MKTLATLILLTAPFAAAQSLDFETYRTKVEPIFLKKRPTHARCIVCHSGGGGNGFFAPLAEGQTSFTEEQSRQNFQRIQRLVNVQNPMASPLLKHPLAETAGGDDFHSGGRQFASQDDPDWKAISDWIKAAK
jgi:hypothetical protein